MGSPCSGPSGWRAVCQDLGTSSQLESGGWTVGKLRSFAHETVALSAQSLLVGAHLSRHLGCGGRKKPKKSTALRGTNLPILPIVARCTTHPVVTCKTTFPRNPKEIHLSERSKGNPRQIHPLVALQQGRNPSHLPGYQTGLPLLSLVCVAK